MVSINETSQQKFKIVPYNEVYCGTRKKMSCLSTEGRTFTTHFVNLKVNLVDYQNEFLISFVYELFMHNKKLLKYLYVVLIKILWRKQRGGGEQENLSGDNTTEIRGGGSR